MTEEFKEIQNILSNIPGILSTNVGDNMLRHYVITVTINKYFINYNATIGKVVFINNNYECLRLSDVWNDLSLEQRQYILYHLDIFNC